VARYLEKIGLAALLTHVEGRDPSEPGLMKPDPTLVLRAIHALNGRHETAVLIGDSTTDLEAAQAAGIRTVGYANKSGKAEKLATAGATVVVASMIDLAASVRQM
ncbi:MAG: HAD family hydrolase, partial [Geodermatophilaceae bacterium]|nr:HAD family hydrolase [Geodermatophilaceae bacterium]